MDLLEIKSNDVKEAWFIKIMCMLQREIEKQIYLEDGCKKKPCPRSWRECVGMTTSRNQGRTLSVHCDDEDETNGWIWRASQCHMT